LTNFIKELYAKSVGAAFTKTWVAARHQSVSLPRCHETNVAGVVRRCYLRNRCRRRGHVFVVAAGAAAIVFRVQDAGVCDETPDDISTTSGVGPTKYCPALSCYLLFTCCYLSCSRDVLSRDVISRVCSRPRLGLAFTATVPYSTDDSVTRRGRSSWQLSDKRLILTRCDLLMLAFRQFLRATAYAIARMCYRPSVRPSVCPSVTRVDQSKTLEVRIMQLSQLCSPMTLVSSWLTSPLNSKGNEHREPGRQIRKG